MSRTLSANAEPIPFLTVLLLLGVTQIIGYGTLYYSFSILSSAMSRDFGWSQEWNFGLLSVGFLVNGLVATLTGRWADRFGAGLTMAGGSLLAAVTLVFCAIAKSGLGFSFGVIASQIAAAFVQYSASFAFLVQLSPRRAPKNITILTLMAGFASTLFWPLTTWLSNVIDWRAIYLIFAALHALICLPAHFYLSRITRERLVVDTSDAAIEMQDVVYGSLLPHQHRIGFGLLAIGMGLLSLVNSSILVHMVPTLMALGLGSASVLISTIFGPAQVLARFSNMVFGREISAISLSVFAAFFEAVGPLILVLYAPQIFGGVGFAIIFGIGSGLGSIVQGTLPLALFGSEGYGALVGKLTAIRLGVGSLAPFVFSSLQHWSSINMALIFVFVTGCCSVLSFIGLHFLPAGQKNGG